MQSKLLCHAAGDPDSLQFSLPSHLWWKILILTLTRDLVQLQQGSSISYQGRKQERHKQQRTERPKQSELSPSRRFSLNLFPTSIYISGLLVGFYLYISLVCFIIGKGYWVASQRSLLWLLIPQIYCIFLQPKNRNREFLKLFKINQTFFFVQGLLHGYSY